MWELISSRITVRENVCIYSWRREGCEHWWRPPRRTLASRPWLHALRGKKTVPTWKRSRRGLWIIWTQQLMTSGKTDCCRDVSTTKMQQLTPKDSDDGTDLYFRCWGEPSLFELMKKGNWKSTESQFSFRWDLTQPVRSFVAPDQTRGDVTEPPVCRYLLGAAAGWKAPGVQQMVLTAALGSMRRCCRTLASSQRPDTHRRSSSHSSRPNTFARAHTPPTAPRRPDGSGGKESTWKTHFFSLLLDFLTRCYRLLRAERWSPPFQPPHPFLVINTSQ